MIEDLQLCVGDDGFLLVWRGGVNLRLRKVEELVRKGGGGRNL